MSRKFAERFFPWIFRWKCYVPGVEILGEIVGPLILWGVGGVVSCGSLRQLDCLVLLGKELTGSGYFYFRH